MASIAGLTRNKFKPSKIKPIPTRIATYNGSASKKAARKAAMKPRITINIDVNLDTVLIAKKIPKKPTIISTNATK